MEKYLRKCLDSLIVSDENMELLEVLVINDGSKDSSSQIAHEYENKFPNTFKVVDKENGNYGSCVNRGLKEASGKYVKVLDADDFFDTKVFEEYINFLRNTDVDIIMTDYNIVNEVGKINFRCLIPYQDKRILNVSDYCEEQAFIELQMHAVTYRLSKLIENNYSQTTGVSYTDQEWMFLPITYMDTFCHYQGALYQYLVGRAGQTVDKTISSKQYSTRFDLFYKRIDLFEKKSIDSNVDIKKKKYLENRLLHGAYTMYKNSLILHECSEMMITEFDRELKTRSIYIYNKIPNSKICRCRNIEFIGYWRKKQKLPFGVKVWKLLKNISNLIRYK